MSRVIVHGGQQSWTNRLKCEICLLFLARIAYGCAEVCRLSFTWRILPLRTLKSTLTVLLLELTAAIVIGSLLLTLFLPALLQPTGSRLRLEAALLREENSDREMIINGMAKAILKLTRAGGCSRQTAPGRANNPKPIDRTLSATALRTWPSAQPRHWRPPVLWYHPTRGLRQYHGAGDA